MPDSNSRHNDNFSMRNRQSGVVGIPGVRIRRPFPHALRLYGADNLPCPRYVVSGLFARFSKFCVIDLCLMGIIGSPRLVGATDIVSAFL